MPRHRVQQREERPPPHGTDLYSRKACRLIRNPRDPATRDDSRYLLVS